jgi:hypothetical protein
MGTSASLGPLIAIQVLAQTAQCAGAEILSFIRSKAERDG